VTKKALHLIPITIGLLLYIAFGFRGKGPCVI